MGDPSYTVIGLGMRGVVDQNRNQPDDDYSPDKP